MRAVVASILVVVGLLAGCSQMAAQGAPSATGARPVWNGHGYYPDDGVQPLCPARDAGHRATVGKGRHAFRVRCDRDGSIWVWDAV